MADSPFNYLDGILHAEDVDVRQIAGHVGTPFYCYSASAIRNNYAAIATAFGSSNALICYAMKANSNLTVLKLLAELGAGMDVVSEGELRRAVAVGVKGEKILFSGVGKTADEISYALDQNILSFNVESEDELRLISSIAAGRQRTAPIALRINPDVDAHTHKKVSTGKSEDKFGIPLSQARQVAALAKSLPGVNLSGIHIHIGSQITTIEPLVQAIRKIADLIGQLRDDGHCIEHMDVGGGLGWLTYVENFFLGILYDRNRSSQPPTIADYAATVTNLTRHLNVQLQLEPGRLIVGNAGILVTKVLYLKQGDTKRFCVVDAAMNDLIRPTLYDSFHEIRPVVEGRLKRTVMTVDVVGPICETGDYLAIDREMPAVNPNDLLAIMCTGAYGATMGSTYNSRLMAPEILVDKNQWAIVRRRQTYEEQMALETGECKWTLIQ